MRIVFATENPGKINEVRKFSEQFGVEILSPSEAGLASREVEETGNDYETNARLKVEAYLDQPVAKNLIIIGDDTGIEIDALGGEPGIHTRRWLGYRMSDDEIVGYAFGRMHGIPKEKRTATFRSTVAYSINGGDIHFVTGELPGSITETPMLDAPHQEGVPFRRIFTVTEGHIPLWQFDETPPDKRSLSHRESAFKKLFEILKEQEK